MGTESKDVQQQQQSATEQLSPIEQITTVTSEEVILRKDLNCGLKLSSPVREDGLIDEDVNVKERAATFGGCNLQLQNNQNEKQQQQANLPKYNRSKSMWTNSTTTAKVIKPPRPISDDSSNGTSRKISPGSPSKIRDMAAFFEQHQKN